MQPTIKFNGNEIQGNALREEYNNFIVSRQAKRCSTATINFYQYTARTFIIWAEQNDGISKPRQINSNLVRAFLADLSKRSTSDWTINDHARAIRTLLKFWNSEGVISHPVTFEMPRVRKCPFSILTNCAN